MRTVYISGPYTAPTTEERDANVKRANEEAQRWAAAGWAPYCPHTQSWNWENDTDLAYDDFLAIDMEWLKRVDAVCVLPRWQESAGACREVEEAEIMGLPIYYTKTYYEDGDMLTPEDVDERMHDVHELALNVPPGLEQFTENLLVAVEHVTQTVIDRQAKYGPTNIAAFGLPGLVCRMRDKWERLFQQFWLGAVAEDEADEDGFVDMAGYSLIAIMAWLNRWPLPVPKSMASIIHGAQREPMGQYCPARDLEAPLDQRDVAMMDCPLVTKWPSGMVCDSACDAVGSEPGA